MMRRAIVLIVALSVSSFAFGQDTLKVMSYNLLSYVDASRDQYYRTVLRHVRPDMLVVEEMTSQAMVDAFFNNVVNIVFPGQFMAGVFVNGFDTDNAIYYKTSKFTFVANTPIRTALRDISEFKLFSIVAADTLRVYAVHLKASSGSANEADRAAEVDRLRAVTNALPSGKYFMVLGDFNIYGSNEQAYQRLLQDNPTDDGHFVDALSLPGSWNVPSYAPYHTQSPRVRQFGGGATGGMDDRFDMILYSRAVSQQGRIRYLLNSLTPIGNDGNHYNDSINRLPNAAVPDSVANALHYASDHLPVSSRFIFTGPQVSFVIAATAGSNGTISPNGQVSVPSGSSQTFTITPNGGYQVDSLVADGVYVGAQLSYTFANVTSDHSIRAVFRNAVNVILASSSGSGSISPTGAVSVNFGTNQRFTITPATGNNVDSVMVDGLRVDSTTSYTFTNVVTNHSITARFGVDGQSQQTTFAVNTGWNLISVPRVPPDNSTTILFPGAVSGTVNSFLTGTYVQPGTLTTGEGYWAFYGAAGSNTISGLSLDAVSITVTSGNRWVLVGSVTGSRPASSLTSTPAHAIVPGTLFSWDGLSYATPTTLDPGHGYWVFVNQPCTLTIQPLVQPPTETPQ